MADKKISQLTGATTPLGGTEVLPIVQSGSTVKVSVDNITVGRAVSVGSLSSAAAVKLDNGQQLQWNTSGGSPAAILKLNSSNNVEFGDSQSSSQAMVLSNGTLTITNGNIVQGTAAKGVTTASSFSLGLGTNGSTSQVNIDTAGNLAINTAGKGITGAFYQKVATGTLAASSSKTLTITTAGRVAQFQIVADVGGSGAGSLNVQVQGLLSNASYYSLVESGKFSYLNIVMGSATAGNGAITIPITNNNGSAATVTVMGIGDGDFSIAIA